MWFNCHITYSLHIMLKGCNLHYITLHNISYIILSLTWVTVATLIYLLLKLYSDQQHVLQPLNYLTWRPNLSLTLLTSSTCGLHNQHYTIQFARTNSLITSTIKINFINHKWFIFALLPLIDAYLCALCSFWVSYNNNRFLNDHAPVHSSVICHLGNYFSTL